jgi:hypothetical protein
MTAIADLEATRTIDTSLESLKTHTTFTQFAQSFKQLRSVACNTALSPKTQLRANEELTAALDRGQSWFAIPSTIASFSAQPGRQALLPKYLRVMADFIVSSKVPCRGIQRVLRELTIRFFAGAHSGDARDDQGILRGTRSGAGGSESAERTW